MIVKRLRHACGMKEMSAEENNTQTLKELSSAEAPVKEWRKPILTIIPANSAENSPGSTPDAGVDYS